MHQFSEATRTWFAAAFAAPTNAQSGAWEAISAGHHALVVAPTGSGKTLSAFLWSIDRLATEPVPEAKKLRCRVLYVSPLKALAVDVERNLRAPLVGIRQTAERLGVEVPEVKVGVRSGDTSPQERRRIQTAPPDILITTPESLFLMLTSQARESLRGVETVIIDEVHAVAGTKRGAHLAISLERLDELLDKPAQRIGLSATVRPVDEVARFLGGSAPVEVVAPASEKEWDLKVVVPVEDMRELDEEGDDGRTGSLWPHVEARVLDLIEQHKSTIVFANSRRLAERLTARLNELAAERAEAGRWFETPRSSAPQPPGSGSRTPAETMAQSGQSEGADFLVARAHHGSVSKEQRSIIEDDLKRGRLPCVVATSSLELGIDMGAVDLVVQIESPPSVASALQRVGRAGHQVGEVSRGVLFPKHRGDLVPSAVTVERMRTGGIEALHVPANPLDVLAQQVVAATSMDTWDADNLFDVVRRSAAFATLPRSAYDATLDLLSGRYPSDEFAELRPRLVWDRVSGELSGRPGAQRLAVTSGGTIPDRGLFGVFLVGEKASRVGELDEEMVYESRVGDVFTLGTTTWRIEDITHDRVLVSPAPGQPGRLPFWTGDTLGRPAELGAAVGQFTREVSAMTREQAIARATDAGLDEWAADNLVSLIEEQKEATQAVPHDQQLVVERFRDELGDWRLVVHSPFGTPVHSPWALAIGARLRERYGVDAQAMATDDGIVLRIPETDQDPPGAELIAFEPDELEQIVTTEVGGSALFASRFRECAARALLLPRRDPGRRAPLWQQRQRSAQLLAVAARYPSFPIILETVREVLQDLYDLPSLVDLHRRISDRRLRLVDVNTQRPSPFAQSLLFGYVAAFMYEGDSPIAERRAAALTLDQGLLAELLGRAELRELLDPEVLAEVESELQRLAEDRRVRDNEGIADLLRMLGPLSTEEIQARCTTPDKVTDWIEMLVDSRRVVPVLMSGQERWAVVEDVARLRDGLGVPVPPGVPDVFTEPVEDPLGDLVGRYARTHGPFSAGEVAERLGLGVAVCNQTLARLAAQGRVLEGEFRPSGSGAEWCDAEVLRSLRRRSLARLRHEVEPVEPVALARYLPAWQNVGGRLRGVDGVVTVIEQLAGCAVPASSLESLVLPSRVADYQPSMLDELTRDGRGALGRARRPAGFRRLGLAAHGRHRTPDPARPRRAGAVGGPRGGARGVGRRRRLLLPPAGDGCRDLGRQGTLGRSLGPRLVGPRRQRHARAAARPHPGRPERSPGEARTRASTSRAAPALRRSTSVGASRGRGSLVPAAPARDRPHQAGTRRRREPARTARRGHPRRGDERAHARWFRRDLPRALGVRGHRTLPARLLRGRARRCPVRYGRRHRPAAHLHEHRPPREADGARPRRDRPGQPVRRGAAVAATGVGAPARSQGGCDRRAGGRRTHSLRRARRQDTAHLHRGRGGPGARHRGARPRRTRRGAGAPHRREGRRRQHPGRGLRGPAAGDGVGRLHRDPARPPPEGLIARA